MGPSGILGGSLGIVCDRHKAGARLSCIDSVAVMLLSLTLPYLKPCYSHGSRTGRWLALIFRASLARPGGPCGDNLAVVPGCCLLRCIYTSLAKYASVQGPFGSRPGCHLCELTRGPHWQCLLWDSRKPWPE